MYSMDKKHFFKIRLEDLNAAWPTKILEHTCLEVKDAKENFNRAPMMFPDSSSIFYNPDCKKVDAVKT